MRARVAALVALGMLGGLAVQACADEATVDACADVRCVQAPPALCEGDVKIVYLAVGTCSSDPTGATRCDYPVAQRQNCADLGGKICRDAQCITPPVVPCEGITCFTPPAPDCAGNIAQIYSGSGSCDPAIPPAGACRYPVDATLDCAATQKVCRAGACVDPSETPCDPNPCDVPPQGGCAGNIPEVPVALGACTAGDDGATCAFTTSLGTACSGATAECRFGRCASGLGKPTRAGDLIIDEVMKNPALAGDETEWFELFNTTGQALELDGCTVSDDGNESWTVPDSDVFVPAGGYIVLGKSGDWNDNGGFVPDALYDGLTLGNNADEIIVTCAGVVIDRLAWASDWPTGTGRAMSLRPTALSASDNDLIAGWCDAPSYYGNQSNRGSPRRANPACP